jgi:hypothetical protein
VTSTAALSRPFSLGRFLDVLPIEAHHLARARPPFTKHWGKKSTELASDSSYSRRIRVYCAPSYTESTQQKMEAEMLCVHVTHKKKTKKEKRLKRLQSTVSSMTKQKRKE